MRFMLLALPLVLVLPACSSEDEPAKGTDVTIDAKTDDGSDVAIKADGSTGKVGIKIPGFDANIRLPKVLLDDANFDIDGAKLYPGSTVSTVNVKADESAAKGDQAHVVIGFTSPAEAAKVGPWLKEEFGKNKITLSGEGNELSGKTSDGNAFTIKLSDDGGKTKGVIDIVG